MPSAEPTGWSRLRGTLPALSSWRGTQTAARPSPGLARGLVVAFLCCLGLLGAARVLFLSPTTWQAALGVGYVVALVAIQLAFTSKLGRDRRPAGAAWVLLAQAALVYLPLLHLTWWLGLPGILAGSALLALRPAFSLPLSVGVVLSFGWLEAYLNHDVFTGVYAALTTLMTGLAVYGLTTLERLALQIYAARDELARLVVAEERLRFARQLQDLLAVRLSAVIARAERARGQFDQRLSDVGDALQEILAISREALADVRSVARGYQRLSLTNELAAAQSVLTAAGVEVRVERKGPAWSGPEGALLATVLREGATNVLRHSEARQCQITLRALDGMAHMEIVNDGVQPETAPDPDDDPITGLSQRVGELGGSVESLTTPDGRFVLRVSTPLGGRGRDAAEPIRSGPRDIVPRMSQRLANGTFGGVLACFGVIALADVMIENPDPRQAVIGGVFLVAILGMQLGYFGRPGVRLHPAVSVPMVLLQAALVYGLILQFGEWWLRSLPGFVAASLLLVLRPAISAPFAAAIVGSEAVLRAMYGGGAYEIVGDVITTATTAILVFGLTRLARLVSEFHEAQSQLARMAIAEERLRFARDLHDLLGLSMSAITLKTSLAAHLLTARPKRAQEQLAEIVTLSRKALGDVRSVASGYLELSLDEELSLAPSRPDARLTGRKRCL